MRLFGNKLYPRVESFLDQLKFSHNYWRAGVKAGRRDGSVRDCKFARSNFRWFGIVECDDST